MSLPSIDRDLRWVIKTFRPLLQDLKVQNIPSAPDSHKVYLSDGRNWIVKGMGRCIVAIRQQKLPENIGGIFIVSHKSKLDYFKLQIIINTAHVNLNKQKKIDRMKIFPDEHFRLGFEDMPVSYPVIFEEFLLSKEMFDEYFTDDTVQKICEALLEKDRDNFSKLAIPLIDRIAEDKALDIEFAKARIVDILTPIYADFKMKRKP